MIDHQSTSPDVCDRACGSGGHTLGSGAWADRGGDRHNDRAAWHLSELRLNTVFLRDTRNARSTDLPDAPLGTARPSSVTLV